MAANQNTAGPLLEREYPVVCLEKVKRPGQYEVCPSCGGHKRKNAKQCKICWVIALKTPSVEIPQPVDESYRFIPLTQGKYAIVDAADYDWLRRYKWSAFRCPKMKLFYAVRHTPSADGKRVMVFMHRQIMGLEFGDPRTIDHVNTSASCDNRRENLRIATSAEQQRNRRKPETNTSGYKGASFRKADGLFQAQIKVNYKSIYLGARATAKAAHEELYVPAAHKHHGDFARTD